MNIVYTSKAKDDLVKIDWRIRQQIVAYLARVTKDTSGGDLPKIYDSEFHKIDYGNHVIIGRVEAQNLDIVAVLPKQKLRLPA